jgi:hypothetical protein
MVVTKLKKSKEVVESEGLLDILRIVKRNQRAASYGYFILFNAKLDAFAFTMYSSDSVSDNPTNLDI